MTPDDVHRNIDKTWGGLLTENEIVRMHEFVQAGILDPSVTNEEFVDKYWQIVEGKD